MNKRLTLQTRGGAISRNQILDSNGQVLSSAQSLKDQNDTNKKAKHSRTT